MPNRCNGIDEAVWDPATDPHIAENYSRDDPRGKAACKVVLQRRMGLPESAQAPLFAMSTRMVEQKGFDLAHGCLAKVNDVHEVGNRAPPAHLP
jgi:starch synthase